MRPFLLCFFLSLLCIDAAHAQGFSSFSGRNHPELDWQVAETEHFKIMYPRRLAGIEAEAASIAEASYAALSANLNVTFDEKIRIYLSDEDEITNGFAVDIGSGYTNIWVHVNEIADVWTGREKWLRKVLAHELAHIFHYRAVASGLGLWANLIANPLPRFWTEGLAQYETETWDAQRGDRWLRVATLDDQLNYEDARSIWNGRLLYAVGNAQVRYFASTYGDSTLAELLAHRKKVLLGLARVHDFNTAFEAVTDKSYRTFYDDWRRHINVYYNTLAGQMEMPDSLDTDPLGVPGQYLYDVRYSPDTAKVAVLSLSSIDRPVRRLYVVTREGEGREVDIVADGSIDGPVSWSPDGRQIAFSRTTRGRYGSLVNDLFLVDADGENLRRLTDSRRAASPTFAPNPADRRLAFVGSTGGTANLFVLDLATGRETQLTHFEGDVQISTVRWHPFGNQLAFARFDAEGRRDLVLLDMDTGALRPLTEGLADDRIPVWSPDGRQIAYTSLRDNVPNAFVYDLESGTSRRVTRFAVGASVHDWLPADSAFAGGSLILVSNVSKARDRAYRIDALRSVPDTLKADVPAGFAAWTAHRPPHEVPTAVPPDPTLIQRRYDYNAFENITHAATLVIPYYDGPHDWGLIGLTGWLEPLGKHLFSFIGGLSFASPVDYSLFAASYVNNQWYPTLSFSAYRMPGSTRLYGNDLLVENFAGGDVTMVWPLDWRVRPYVSTMLAARVRYVDIDPLEAEVFETPVEGLLSPEAGQQADLRLTLERSKQRPYKNNVIHPLDGEGVRLQLTGAAPVLGGDSHFLRGDLSAYTILRSIGLHRIYVYGRAQAQTGSPFDQDFIGLSRYDHAQIALPGFVPFTFGDTERVRGYRSYVLGDRVLFGSVEYRMPLLSDLQTTLLGLVSLGGTSLAAFADAGLVWTGADLGGAIDRVGIGMEIKNALRLGGFFEMSHALGVAQPAADLGTEDNYEIYYRIRAAVPF